MYWNLIVIAICLVLLLFLLWKEIKRSYKSWLAARIISSTFAVISFACLALPVSVNKKHQVSNSTSTILLTEGFDNDSVQKILSSKKEARIFTTIKNRNNFDTGYNRDVSDLGEFFENAGAIEIFGFGLNENDLGLLKNRPVIFHPSVIKNSITGISWIRNLTLGEPLVVQGTFNNAAASPAKVILTGFNINFDSISLPANQTSYFQLTASIKHLDKAVYSVTVLYGKDTIEKESVPFEVKITQPFNILILAASPDFENKFLKNWLAKNEYKFVVRTRISKDKYDKRFVNMLAFPLDRSTASLLEKFDCIIADASELSALPAADIAAIKNYVESKGSGLIVKADSVYNSSAFYLRLFPLIETQDSIQNTVKLHFSDSGKVTSSLKIEQPVYIRHVSGTQSLIKDQLMRTVVSSKIYGSGKVILTTILNTYTWRLSGNNNDYSAYWSWILGKAAKQIPLQEVWNVTPALPLKNEEVHLNLHTAKATVPQVQTGQDKVYMEQNYYLPYEWNGICWPKKTGWQSLTEGGGAAYWWYAYDNKDWQGIKALDKINATKKYANDHPYKPHSKPSTIVNTNIEVPKFYFFLLFIICTGFLWIEKKFKGS